MFRHFAAPAAALAVALTAVVIVPAGRSAANEDRCTIAVKGQSPVAEACKTGGIRAAKRTMQQLKKAAKKKGMARIDCDDCHKDASGDNFALAKDAPDRFKEMLKLAGDESR